MLNPEIINIIFFARDLNSDITDNSKDFISLTAS